MTIMINATDHEFSFSERGSMEQQRQRRSLFSEDLHIFKILIVIRVECLMDKFQTKCQTMYD